MSGARPPVVIVGAGALGGYVGAMLALAGQAVVLVDEWPAHVDATRRHGLRIDAPGGAVVAQPDILHLDDLSTLQGRPVAFFLVCVKLYDTVRIVGALKRCWSAPTPVVTMQNGMVDDTVAGLIGPGFVLGAIATGLNVAMQGPGRIRRSSHRHAKVAFQVGELSGASTPRLQAIVDTLAHVDHACAIEDLQSKRWHKLGINAMTSGLAALTGMSTSEIYRDPIVQRVVTLLGCESTEVGAALGFEPQPVLGESWTTWQSALRGDVRAREALHQAFEHEAQRVDASFKSGMLQDMMAGRPTEVDYFNGYIAEQGAAVGQPATAHALVAQGVRTLSALGQRPDRHKLDGLLAQLQGAA